ncbi:hypothetical protein H0A64_07145 [Alcaligenaceae bacterium]|nr:hypothetical protein [Alcaligenaceae bacterium]
MKVIAISAGYRGKLREPGDTFDVPSGSKATWYVPAPADPETPGKNSGGRPAARTNGGRAGATAGAAGSDDLV